MNLKPYADSCVVTLDNLKKKIADHGAQLDKLRREQRGIEIDKARANAAQGNINQPTPRPGRIQGTLPAVGQTAQIMKNGSYVRNSFSPTFSMLEGAPIEETIYRPYLVDQFGVPIVELTSKGLVDANNAVGTTNVVRPMRTTAMRQQQMAQQQQPQQSGVQVQNNNQQQQQNQNQQQQQAQPRNFDKELDANQQSQAKAKAVQQVYHIAATVATSKLTVTENMFKEYAKILNNVIAVVKRYHGIQSDKAEQAEQAEQVRQGRQAELNAQKHKTAMAKERRKTIDAGRPRRGILKLAKDALW
jgi:hypothetical protein